MMWRSKRVAIDQVSLDNEWMKKLHEKLIIAVCGDDKEKESVYEGIGYYYECYAPASLYKYYSDSPRNLENVKNNKMWFSAPINFNDIFDCDITVDKEKVEKSILEICPSMRGVRVGSPMWKTFKAQTRTSIKSMQDTFAEMRSTMGIVCLSELDDSLLMWAHYANNHCGMCVEYELLEFNKKLMFTPVPIIYSEERVCFTSFNTSTVERDASELFIKSLTTKSLDWSYEKEWRIIRDDAACGSKWDTNKKGALLSVIRPSSIILGYMVKPEFEKEVYTYCEANKINLFKMQKDTKKFCLVKTPLLEFGD